MRGRLITLEGLDGAGKSSHLDTVRKVLDQHGIPNTMTREPGGTPLGESIRELLLGRPELHIVPEAELLLIFAARAQHLDQIVRPCLEHGDWVVSDRFTDATYAYQGGGRGIADARISILEQWVQGDLRPDLTLLFDLAVETAARRTGHRASLGDRFESENFEYMERVRASYLRAHQAEPDRFRLINAGEAPDAVAAAVMRIIEDYIDAVAA